MKTHLNSLLCVATVTALFSQIQVATATPVPTNGPSLSSFANDDAFLEYIEKTTFQYFWNESGTNGLTKVSYNGTGQPAQPNVIGLALNSYNIAIERGWITRSNGAARVLATLRSLWNTPQGTNSTDNFIYSGYKGWFYQSLDPDTGLRNGGINNQLSSSGTSTLMLGVIDSGLFFTNLTDQAESEIRTLSSNLVNRVEFDWLMDSEGRMLYGWSPEGGFSTSGWGAGMQGYYIYLLGLGMPYHPLPPEAWTFWTSTYNWKNYYGYEYIYSDALFIHQHTHLWYDLRGIADQSMWERGSDYFEDCRRITLVHQAYAIENPLNFANYGTNEWGLNECDSPHGYTVYGCPDALDEGVISPSAAASSMPMTPEISLSAIKNIYSKYSNLVWSTEGFMDCYAANTNCFTNFYFSTQVSGLQQGRILLMIENYRTGSTWNRMKTSPIIQRGLAQAGLFVRSTSAALPPPWTKADIGAEKHLSGNSFYSNGVYTVTGAGTISLKTSDSFNYCYQPASGNCTIQARVTSIGDTNTSSSARAGIMIRETLATNSTHASMLFEPTSNGGGFYTRTSTGGSNSRSTVTEALPYWVKVTRSGNNFSGFVSANGTNWTQVGTTKTINMTSNVYIGLVVSSSQDLVPCKTSFTNVTVSGYYALTVNSGTGGGSYTNGTQVAISATAISGKAFVRWTGDTQYVNNVTYTNALVTMSTNPVSLTATYVDVYYALTVNNGTGGGGSYTNGRQVAISANAPAIGKAFVRWAGDTAYVANSNSASTTVTMPAQAVTLTATYVDVYYALTVTGGSGSGSYTNGRQVAISADAPTIGKVFSQWVGDTQYVASASSANTTLTMPAKAIALTATYVDVLYTLTVNSGTGGGSYTNGRQVAISANAPAAGKIFSQWTGDTQYVASVSSSSTTVTMPVQAVALTATYVDVLYTLTVTGGTGGGSSYTNAQVVAILANAPASGTIFDKWTGSTQYVNNVTYTNALVTMSAQDAALTATYKNLPGYYTLTVSNGTGSGAYTNGTQVAIAAVAPTGTAFDQWTGDTQVVAGVFSFNTTVTMPAQDTTLTASCVDISNGVASVTWASGIIYYEPDFASLLGPTGSGKSTIAQLMYSPDDIKDSILPSGAGAVNDVVWDTITLTENGDGVIEWGMFSASTVRAGTNGYVYALIFQDNNVQPGTLYVAGPLAALVDGGADVNVCADPGNGDAINGVNSAPVMGGITTYALTVNNGTGSGSYTNGQQVAIAASNAPSGKVFDKWTGDTQYVASVSSSNTTVTMPSQAIALTATYADIYYLLTANGATGGSVSPASTNVIFGGSAGFVVTASNYYRIATLTTNGANVAGMSFDNGSTTTNFIWSNVQTSGVLAATFTQRVTTNAPAQVPYEWLAQYGLTNYNTDAAADQDQDGLSAWQEYIAGTNPTNAVSCFKAAQNTRNIISWSAVSGRVYSVYWSTNLVKGFTMKQDNILYPTNNYTNAAPDGRVNHYQLKVRMQ